MYIDAHQSEIFAAERVPNMLSFLHIMLNIG
jgi:hypothetical protein